jgi:hypothetical protein
MRLIYLYLFAIYALWISVEWIAFTCVFMAYVTTSPDLDLESGLITLLGLGTIVLPGLGALSSRNSLDGRWDATHNVEVDKVPSDED